MARLPEKKMIRKPTAALLFVLLAAFPVLADDAVRLIATEDILADSSVLADHAVVSGGQPDAEVLRLLGEAGFTTIIDLRTDAEDRGFGEQAAVESMGMSYVTLPIAGADGITFENAEELDRLIEGSEGRVFVHCASGNRVGALIALGASMQGASREEAIAAGQAAGMTRLEPLVIEKLTEK